MVRYDFDSVLDRRHTLSLKWDHCRDTFGLDDVIPMWVADMDFAAPPAVVEAIARRAAHGAYGYVSVPESFWESAIAWLQRRLTRDLGLAPDQVAVLHGQLSDIEQQELVDRYLPHCNVPHRLDHAKPQTVGNMSWPRETEHHRKQIQEAMERVPAVYAEAIDEFEKVFGRRPGGAISSGAGRSA